MKDLNNELKKRMKNMPISSKAYRNIESLLDEVNYKEFLDQVHLIYKEIFKAYTNEIGPEKKRYFASLNELFAINYYIIDKIIYIEIKNESN